EVVLRLTPLAEGSGSSIHLETEGDAAGVWDRARVEQVLSNLLANAVKYGAGKPIEVRVRGGDGAASFSVRDHGIGIAPEDQERIFQRFERAVSPSSYGGFGLGLWVSRQLVEAHRGCIEIES